jgi:uncharacterized membrane protein
MRRKPTRENKAMPEPNPRSTASLAGHPLHAMLVPFPIACFVGAFLTDLTYWRTADMMWANFSIWLITAGLVTGVLAAAAGLTDFFGSRQIRSVRSAWYHGGGNGLALILSLFNAFVHSRDAYTSVVSTGLILSGLVVLILLFTGWLGGALVFRHRVGVVSR